MTDVPVYSEEEYATSGGALDRFANDVGHLLADHAGLTHFDTLGILGSRREGPRGLSVITVNGSTKFSRPERLAHVDKSLSGFDGTVVRTLGLCQSVEIGRRNGGQQLWVAHFHARVVDRKYRPDLDELLNAPDLRFRIELTSARRGED